MKYTGVLFKVDKYGRERMTILKEHLRKTFHLKMFHYHRHDYLTKGSYSFFYFALFFHVKHFKYAKCKFLKIS